MRSTGEVMGIDADFGKAFFKAEQSAFNSLPLEGTVFISVRDEDKKEMARLAKVLHTNGLKMIGTTGTKKYLEAQGIPVTLISKVHEGSPNVIDLMRRGKVDLIINTPTSKMARKDGSRIRRAAIDYDVPYLTTIQAVRASADAINAMMKKKMRILSLNEYMGHTAPPAPAPDAAKAREPAA
jgi:carbamoyl-phosphate synthase large subunit